MAFKIIDEKKVHVAELNPKGKQTIIMIHGLFSNLSVFYLKIAPRLAKNFHVVLYDMRSHGRSECRSEGYSPEILSDDLLNLMDEMNIEKAYLAGFSFGGIVAMCTALRCPNKTERLALVEMPMLHEPAFSNPYNSKEDFELVVKQYMQSLGVALPKIMMEKVLTKMLSSFGNGMLQEAFKDGRRFFNEKPPERLSMPALLLYGDKSPFLETGYALRNRIPGVLFDLGNGDHDLPIKEGDWISSHLESFFGVKETEEEEEGVSVPRMPDSNAVFRLKHV